MLSCTREEVEHLPVSRQDEDCGLSVQEAADIFGNCHSDTKSGQFGFMTWDVGNISPDWADAERVHNYYNGNDNVETGFNSNYGLRFYVRNGDGNGVRFLRSERKLLIVKNEDSGLSGAFVLWYVADFSYSHVHRKSLLCKTYHNDGNMNDYSGLVIYTKLDGRVVRANRYDDGFLTNEVYLAGAKSEAEYLGLVACFRQIIGNIVVSRRFSTIRTKSDEDSTDTGFSDVLDSSLCVDEYPDPDTAEEDPWWNSDVFDFPDCPDIPPYEGDNGDIDPGEGACGGGGVQSGSTISDTWNGMKVSGTSQSVNTFIGMTNKFGNIKAIKSLLGKINLKQITQIKVVPGMVGDAEAMTSRIKDQNGTVSFTITIGTDCANGAIFEELLHVLQYQQESNWTSGDKEFEAKVFDAYLQSNYGYPNEGIYFTDLNKLLPFLDFMIRPNKETYDAAMQALFSPPFNYPSYSFHVTPESKMGYEERIKHINDIIKN